MTDTRVLVRANPDTGEVLDASGKVVGVIFPPNHPDEYWLKPLDPACVVQMPERKVLRTIACDFYNFALDDIEVALKGKKP